MMRHDYDEEEGDGLLWPDTVEHSLRCPWCAFTARGSFATVAQAGRQHEADTAPKGGYGPDAHRVQVSEVISDGTVAPLPRRYWASRSAAEVLGIV